MSTYIYPNIPQVFNNGDQILIVFTNKVQEINLKELGISKCKIECFNSVWGAGETNFSADYVAGVTDLSDLLKKGVEKIYAVVGASINYNYGNDNTTTINVPQEKVSYTEYSRFGGSVRNKDDGASWYGGVGQGGRYNPEGASASSDLRTYYNPTKGIYDAQSRNSVIIAAGGRNAGGCATKGVNTSIAGEPAPNNAPNEVIKFTNRVIHPGNAPRLNPHGYIIITAIGDDYIANKNYTLEIKTPNGKKEFPLYNCIKSGNNEYFQIKLPSGEELRAATTSVEPQSDSACIKTPDKRFVTNTNENKQTGVQSGLFKFYNDSYFVVPPNVTGVRIQAYHSTGNNVKNISPWAGNFYLSVIPGCIISGHLGFHQTKYISDTSFHVTFNSQYVMGEGCLGWSGHIGTAPSYGTVEYSDEINKIAANGGGMTFPYVFLNGDKAVYPENGVSSYILKATNGHSTFIPDRNMKVRITLLASKNSYEVEITPDHRIARFFDSRNTCVSVVNVFSSAFFYTSYSEAGNNDIKIDIIS